MASRVNSELADNILSYLVSRRAYLPVRDWPDATLRDEVDLATGGILPVRQLDRLVQMIRLRLNK